MSRIGRNEHCPCGSGKKYKNCCSQKVPWETLADRPIEEAVPFLSLRGRNRAFIGHVLATLQIDTWKPNLPYSQIKRAFTPKVVREIFEAIPIFWPNYSDLIKCLAKESETTTALYTGSYEPEDVFKVLIRHSTYSDRILLTDPFLDPRRVAPQYSPLLYPEQHRANAVKCTFLWLNLLPWIEAGIVGFVRPPTDFVSGLWTKILDTQRKRYDEHPELTSSLERHVDAMVAKAGPMDRGFHEWHWLSNSDDFFREVHAEMSDPKGSVDEFLEFIRRRRDAHPYFVERLPGCNEEIIIQTTGACYELAKLICAFTNSHLITDMEPRWKEIELDRAAMTGNLAAWSPFAKALQSAQLRALDKTSLDAALTLRKENRLEGMRMFFRKIWKSCRDPHEFAEPNALNLVAELHEKISEARSEWSKIDQDILKWFGTAGGAIAAASFAGFLPAAAAGSAAAVSGIAALASARMGRRSFRERYPAGYFLRLDTIS